MKVRSYLMLVGVCSSILMSACSVTPVNQQGDFAQGKTGQKELSQSKSGNTLHYRGIRYAEISGDLLCTYSGKVGASIFIPKRNLNNECPKTVPADF